MAKLYIVGAGCSRNYTQGLTDIPDLKSPLDRDFFKMAKRLLKHKSMDLKFRERFNYLLKDLIQMFGEGSSNVQTRLNSEEKLSILDSPKLGLEKVMTEFFIKKELFERPTYQYGWQGAGGSIGSKRLYTFVELIARTFEEALRGPICEKHLALAERMTRGDFVFSYNYDLLMDNALRRKGRLTDEGYGLTFNRVYDASQWLGPEIDESEVRLLKLHGSLNWIRCSICGSNLLLRKGKVGEWITTIPNKCPKCHSEEEYMQRLIVPPFQTKNYTDPAIGYLWFEAVKALRKIQEIVIIGYSLPLTDFASEALFRVGINRIRRKRLRVTIVNPNDAVPSRFSEIFNPKEIVTYKSLETFLRRTD